MKKPKPKEATRTMTVRISSKVFVQAKLAAVARGESLQKFMTDALIEHLQSTHKGGQS